MEHTGVVKSHHAFDKDCTVCRLQAENKKLRKAGNEFIETFIPHDSDSICFRAYNKLKQALKGDSNV